MKNFVSIIFDEKPINEDIDVAVVAATSSANVGLLENEFEYEIYESENSTYVITIPTIKSLNEDDAYNHAQKLADKLFDAGFENFDIEFSVLESQINEATLRRGSRGEEVRALQQQLGVTADGIFGPATEQALRAFQQRAGIQVDGIAGGQTQAALAAGGSPRNAGAARPSTTPFQPGQGSTTQAPPAGGDMNLQGPADGDMNLQGPADGDMNLQGSTPAAPQATTLPQSPLSRPVELRGPNTNTGDVASTLATGGGRGDGNAEVARRRADAQNAASDRQLIARAQGATTTAPTPAAPQAQTTPSAARAAGQPGRAGMAGDETSALDAIAADRASGALPTPTSTEPRNAPADGPAIISGPGQAARPGSAATQAVVEPAAPSSTINAPATAQALGAAMRGFGTDEEGIASALQGIQSQADWDAIKSAYDGDLLADLASELSTRDYQRYVNSVLQAAGVRESVPARPKGAFMFRERAEWDELFGTTYNKDGSPRARTPVFESRKMDEETYHGNEFYEAYGEMWFNEDEELDEAEYQGRKVKLGKPMRGDVKKFKVYVKNPKGNIVKVNFGDPDMKIKKSNPARRRSFRARHNCDNPGPRHKARYWSCRKW